MRAGPTWAVPASPLQELQRAHHQVRGAFAPWCLDLHLACIIELHALVCQRRPGDGAAQLLQPLALVCLHPHGSVLLCCHRCRNTEAKTLDQRDGAAVAHWRTGTRGMTWSTRWAAVCDMRRAPHEGQNPRRLQLKASSLSCPQSPQRSRRKPCARMPHSRKASNSSRTNCGSLAPAAYSDWAKKLWACCCTRRYSVVCLGIGGARSAPGRHRNAPSRCGERWFARAGQENLGWCSFSTICLG